ncbi:efflux transporter [Amylocystis lapponica]|nr:efflux transporter [Amylocystis lapponica]
MSSSIHEHPAPPPQQADDVPAHDVSFHQPPSRSVWQSVGLISTATLVMIVNAANNTAVSIALPTIGVQLNIPEYRLQWILSAYSLSSGCLLLFFGRIADLYGRKLVFMLGACFLCILSIGCGFANNEITLDILRGFQGIGAAACIPAALGILAHAFPPSQLRAFAFATFAAGAPVGAALGSAIGGVLTQLTEKTWRSTFWFIAGLSFISLVGGIVTFDKDLPSTEKDRRVDWLGAFLVTAGLVFIVFVLSDGSIAPNGWSTGYIIALLIVGVILLLLYVAWQYFLEKELNERHYNAWWTPPPLMLLSLWTRASGKLAVVLVIAFLEYCSFLSFNFWVQLYYQDYLGLTPVLTMVRLLPMFVTGIICNVIVALFVGHIPLVYLITLGTSMTAVANLLFAVINPKVTYWAFGFPAAVLSVFGADFVFASGTLFVAKVCLPHEQSVGGALFQTLTQLGAAFGLSISTIVYNSVLKQSSLTYGIVVNQNGTNAPAPAQLHAYKSALWTGSAFGFAGSLLAAIFLHSVGIIGHRAASGEETKIEPAERERSASGETVREKQLPPAEKQGA